MKEYPLSESELNELGRIHRDAAICFSLATGLFGFAINVTKDLAFATTLPESVGTFWSAVRIVCGIGAIVACGFGIVKVREGGTRLEEIKSETDHGDTDTDAS